MSVKIRGNDYNTVAERISSAHTNHPGRLSIQTEITDENSSCVTVKATISIFTESERLTDDSGQPSRELSYNGHAREYFEMENSKAVNFAFAVENAETSAVGRALANAGYLGTEVASDEDRQRQEERRGNRQSQIPTSAWNRSASSKPPEPETTDTSILNGLDDPLGKTNQERDQGHLASISELTSIDQARVMAGMEVSELRLLCQKKFDTREIRKLTREQADQIITELKAKGKE